MKKLLISAGGKNVRLREYCMGNGGVPKHLLPLPRSDTILGHIVAQSSDFFNQIEIHANSQNYAFFDPLFNHRQHVDVIVDHLCTGPLGPLARALLSKKSNKVFGAAGDFYCDFSWESFFKFHEGHNFPVSILLAHSCPTKNPAVFHVENKQITRWERLTGTSSHDDLINIGAYIIENNPEIIHILRNLTTHKEDPFFDVAINKGLVAGYNPNVIGFNINIPLVYKALLQHLR